MLRTRNIFLDTQAFISNNFFEGKNLQRLAHWGKLNIIDIFLTEITKNEIQSNIKDDLLNAKQELNRFKDLITKKARILKNIPEFKSYLDLPELKVDVDFKKLSKELDKFISDGNVKMISYEQADLKSVVTKYFKEEAPFSPGRKKYEFPDALVLSALDNWCIKNKTKIYVVSGDNDFKNYKSKNLLPVDDIKTILDWINKQYDKDLTDWLSRIFELSRGRIIEKLGNAFVEKVKDEIWYDVTINGVSILDIFIEDFSIIDKETDGQYIFQFDYDIEFEVDVTYDDYSYSIYDKEDGKYYGHEKSRTKVKIESTQTAEVEIESYHESGISPEDSDIISLSVSTTIPDASDITDELEGYMVVF